MHYLIKKYEIFKLMIHIINCFPEKLNQFTLRKEEEPSFDNCIFLQSSQAASSIPNL